jgi:hypothetical protein
MKYSKILFTVLLFAACQKNEISKPLSSSNQSSSVNDSIYIGAHYQGGVIFWIDSTGEHGLIAAEHDYRNKAIFWTDWASPEEYAETGAKGKQIGSGKGNSRKILQTLGKPEFGGVPYAAEVCHKLELNGYNDWYLPSVEELLAMYQVKDLIGGFGDRAYWSSTEFNGENAYRVFFGDVPYVSYYDKINWHWVRAIRTF